MNPYQSPCDDSAFNPRWSTFRKTFYSIAAIAFVVLFPIAVNSYVRFCSIATHPNKTPARAVMSFLTDWRMPY